MSLKIYNTMTREQETFVPLEPGKVKMYVCGPTVYDYIHIGNARPVIFFDVVRRYLEFAGYEVEYVSNFTDVDDKLIRKAEQLGTTVPEVAEKFIAAFNENIEGMGVRKASLNPRVTENMSEIVAFIHELVEKGYAYESGGDVYYRTNKFADYGKLSHQNMEELQLGIRIEVDERKEHGQDFVLWKAAKPGEIYWDSPWGQGRPGWHIECSAMARKYLGDTLDIHGGGLDLQFPHHECEIAQSEVLTGKPMARYWMHNGYINIDNQKMSKSLGNGVTVNELLKRTKSAAIRYFMLSSHYRSPLNFNHDTIAQAESSVQRITNCMDNLQHRMAAAGTIAQENLAEIGERVSLIVEQFKAKMNDDFNTPDAITALFELVSEANQYMKQAVVTVQGLQLFIDALQMMDNVLGLLPQAGGNDEKGLPDAEIEALIEERIEARRMKNWARADEIRDLLAAQNIVLEDTPQGIRWKRK
ncbi:cysteine--tRNA ligase [Paenibacillus sp. GCM10027626]|uniref:cysteine--tRNA ligase n=1 Tax=Paenibacillus sp. GCM10027626 TaxID=3273411 RepID=UPI0036433945